MQILGFFVVLVFPINLYLSNKISTKVVGAREKRVWWWQQTRLQQSGSVPTILCWQYWFSQWSGRESDSVSLWETTGLQRMQRMQRAPPLQVLQVPPCADSYHTKHQLVNDKRSSHLKLIDPDTFEDQMPWQYNDAWLVHSRTGPRPPWPRHCCMYWHQGPGQRGHRGK